MSAVKIAVGSIAVLYVVLAMALYFFQENFIFLGEPLPQDYHYKFETPFEELNFDMQDGAVINALHFKSEDRKGIIYYHHGNAGNLARWGGIAEYFVQFGYDVLIYDYRGYGKSSGQRTEENMYQDAKDIYAQLQSEWGEENILLYGRSLGSGLACELAGRNSPKMVILETPFYSLKSMAHYRFPFLPTGLLVKYEMLNWQNLEKAEMPIHIFHGTEDGVVPYESGKRLYETVSDKATFTRVEGAQHNNLIEFEEYQRGLKGILQ